MNKNLAKGLILGGVFLVTLILVWLFSSNKESSSVVYKVLGNSDYPVITLESYGTKINTLYGFSAEVNEGEETNTLTPVGEDRKVGVHIETFGNEIISCVYEIRSIDGANLIEKNSVSNLKEADGEIYGEIKVSDIIDSETEYRLVICLATERNQVINYYSRIRRSDSLKCQEMLDYVKDLHAATFDTAKAEKYAINWEPNDKADNGTLAYTDVHSSFKLLTYKDLKPTQVGDAQIQILEMDDTLGSFKLNFEIEITNESGDTNNLSVEEFICVQWSSIRFYLMSYERRACEYFSANADSVTETGINFGINSEENIKTMTSEEGNYIAYTVGGELWLYSTSNSEFTEVFSFNEGQELSRRLNHNYNLKILSVDNEGKIAFIVYGYIGRGSHEGENGLSYFTYKKDDNSLNELLYIKTARSYGNIETEINRLCKVIGKKVYFLFGDSVYVFNEEDMEVIRLIEEAEEHGLKVNSDQSAIAWAQGQDPKYPQQSMVRYFNNDESYSVSASTGEYIIPQGFVDDDFVATFGKKEEVIVSDLERVYPQYALSINNKNGEEVKHYDSGSARIIKAISGDGKVVLKQARLNGNRYEAIADEVFMQNDKQIEKPVSVLEKTNRGNRLRTYYYPINKEGSSGFNINTPDEISYYEGGLTLTSSDNMNYNISNAMGKVLGTFSEANEAIKIAYDNFGYVTNKNGYRIWHRATKKAKRELVEIPAAFTSDKTKTKLENSIRAMLYVSGHGDMSGEALSKGMSAMEIFDSYTGGIGINLNGLSLKQILVFLERGLPILAVSQSGETNMIIGYDITNVYLYDALNMSTSKVSMDEMTKKLEADDWKMITYINK